MVEKGFQHPIRLTHPGEPDIPANWGNLPICAYDPSIVSPRCLREAAASTTIERSVSVFVRFVYDTHGALSEDSVGALQEQR